MLEGVRKRTARKTLAKVAGRAVLKMRKNEAPQVLCSESGAGLTFDDNRL